MRRDPTTTSEDERADDHADRRADMRRHLRIGWWALLLFLMLGAGLEAMHGFKIGPYLDADYATRRFMWTLSHAHG